MTNLDDCVNSGENALNALYALQTTAMKTGNLAAQKALEDDIDDLTYKLTQLRKKLIAFNGAEINVLNSQLDKVTATAQSSLGDLSELTDVLNDVVTAAQIIDGILKAAVAA